MTQQKLVQQGRKEPQPGQIYRDARDGDSGERYQILYIDEQIVLLRSSNENRLEPRIGFDNSLEADRFTLEGFEEITEESDDEDWAEVAGIGAATDDNLHDAGYDTRLDVVSADESALEDIGGIGSKNLQNLLDYSQ